MKQEDWVDEVLNSMKNNGKAKPHPRTYLAIEKRLDEEVKVISFTQWGSIAAAVALLAVVNIFVFFEVNSFQKTENTHSMENPYSDFLISDFNLYNQ